MKRDNRKGEKMDYSEELKEINANLHMIGVAIEYEDNKEIIQDSIFNIVRNIDRMVENIDHDPTFSGRMQ